MWMHCAHWLAACFDEFLSRDFLAPDKEEDIGFEDVDEFLGCDFLVPKKEDDDHFGGIDDFLGCDFLVPKKEDDDGFEDMVTSVCYDF